LCAVPDVERGDAQHLIDSGELSRSAGRHSRAQCWLDGEGVEVTGATSGHKEPLMAEVVIVEAVRTPVGRRNGGLSSMHSIDLLGAVQREALEGARRAPRAGGQVVGGCVGQVGMQAMNVPRNAWLTAGLPIEV